MKNNINKAFNNFYDTDSQYFRKLFQEHYQWLSNYVYKLCGDSFLSEDIVQEVFIDLWNKREKVDFDNPKSYLFRCCHNKYLHHHRNTKSVTFSKLDEIKAEILFDFYEPDAELFSDQKIVKLSQAIDALPPKCREAFVLNRFENLKYKEVAKEMGISTKTVEIHISKALATLRDIKFS